MSEHDPLAEALYEGVRRRASVPMDDWKDVAEYQRHNLEALAQAARAFMAGEICDVQICEERDPSENSADLTYIDGLDHARQIAWGMADN